MAVNLHYFFSCDFIKPCSARRPEVDAQPLLVGRQVIPLATLDNMLGYLKVGLSGQSQQVKDCRIVP